MFWLVDPEALVHGHLTPLSLGRCETGHHGVEAEVEQSCSLVAAGSRGREPEAGPGTDSLQDTPLTYVLQPGPLLTFPWCAEGL